ncbi:uncharacterized protein BT62DRAFT_327122 [Guyanagaster necrorhizus]|uniref:Uncharacterized protein n=1 Tax=Guyanagaster necrorhizus TaxID=856835 RepID=A0A9P7VMB9_9AGAR|nr:uncharacterized protein BT62DRAFT_327122 [Guyanagaster necrorhizus MCA 3950]KAG7443349.1 hypothetical protein BT62DRAFT_327122 [Guyanagaster necrorhizus MCA 3950]
MGRTPKGFYGPLSVETGTDNRIPRPYKYHRQRASTERISVNLDSAPCHLCHGSLTFPLVRRRQEPSHRSDAQIFLFFKGGGVFLWNLLKEYLRQEELSFRLLRSAASVSSLQHCRWFCFLEKTDMLSSMLLPDHRKDYLLHLYSGRRVVYSTLPQN